MTGTLVPNTLGVPCVAGDMRIVRDAGMLAEHVVKADARHTPTTIIGGGSNLVLRSRLPGLVLLLRIGGLTVERLAASRWRVTAGAGVSWQEVVRATLGRGIGGLENLILIPGTVGAAPLQNIGAYGRELADVVESVTAFDRRCGRFATLSAAECRFRYRDSRFQSEDAGRYVVVRIALRLGHLAPHAGYPDVRRELARMGVGATPVGIAEAVVRVRRRKLPDPRRVGNVGSFFKNPVLTPGQLDALRARLDIDAQPHGEAYKVSAARLIDSAGWRGARHGAVQVWHRQPLVLINRGGATGHDVLDFAARISDDVMHKYGIAMHREPAVKGVD